MIPPARLVRMLSQVALAPTLPTRRSCASRPQARQPVLCQTREGDIVKILDFGSVKDKGESAKKLTVLGTTIGSPFYMAPEQAQGLDTLDHRADVWSLAAIAYECVTGQVPFAGSNGPSILLEILTKEPQAPSRVAVGQKYPVPPTLDRAMAQAFKKMAALRIPSVGALADAVAAAYGLEGAHQQWAVMPEAEIAARIAEKMPALMQTKVERAPADAADSFFGEEYAGGVHSAKVQSQEARPFGGDADSWDLVFCFIERAVDEASGAGEDCAVEEVELPRRQGGARAFELAARKRRVLDHQLRGVDLIARRRARSGRRGVATRDSRRLRAAVLFCPLF